MVRAHVSSGINFVVVPITKALGYKELVECYGIFTCFGSSTFVQAGLIQMRATRLVAVSIEFGLSKVTCVILKYSSFEQVTSLNP